MSQGSDFHLKFQVGSSSYDIDFINDESAQTTDHVIIEGRKYTLRGEAEGIGIIQKYLQELPSESLTRTLITGRLKQLSAKEISFSKVHELGLEILGAKRAFPIQQTIERFCDLLQEKYVFPELAEKCTRYLREKLQAGGYNGIKDPAAFAAAKAFSLINKSLQ